MVHFGDAFHPGLELSRALRRLCNHPALPERAKKTEHKVIFQVLTNDFRVLVETSSLAEARQVRDADEDAVLVQAGPAACSTCLRAGRVMSGPQHANCVVSPLSLKIGTTGRRFLQVGETVTWWIEVPDNYNQEEQE